jgi:ribA/ribD-fused uncharacterized protein
MAHNKLTLFYSGTFSNWYPFAGKKEYSVEEYRRSLFELNGLTFNCTEQHMMAEKARMFDDHETYAKIMEPIHPRDQKALGRKVKNFDLAIWNKYARQIVYEGNQAKFSQNPELLKILLATADTLLVEASPYDQVWGIGLAMEDPLALDPSAWRGTNWLGEVLTNLRDSML